MDPFERAAQQELDEPRMGFRIHLAVYVAVQALLIATWALTSSWDDGFPFPWPIFPLLGWGVGLVAHYAAYSGMRKRRLAKWERPAA